jgi:hypothetical protein
MITSPRRHEGHERVDGIVSLRLCALCALIEK